MEVEWKWKEDEWKKSGSALAQVVSYVYFSFKFKVEES